MRERKRKRKVTNCVKRWIPYVGSYFLNIPWSLLYEKKYEMYFISPFSFASTTRRSVDPFSLKGSLEDNDLKPLIIVFKRDCFD